MNKLDNNLRYKYKTICFSNFNIHLVSFLKPENIIEDSDIKSLKYIPLQSHFDLQLTKNK